VGGEPSVPAPNVVPAVPVVPPVVLSQAVRGGSDDRPADREPGSSGDHHVPAVRVAEVRDPSPPRSAPSSSALVKTRSIPGSPFRAALTAVAWAGLVR